MRDGGRIAAAIQVLDDIELRHKPVRQALKTWSDGARYAGSKDRAWVSGLALDVLRRQRSLAHLMGEESNRSRALAALRWIWDWDMDRLGEAARLAAMPPGEELARSLDPRAVSSRRAALGHQPRPQPTNDWSSASRIGHDYKTKSQSRYCANCKDGSILCWNNAFATVWPMCCNWR